MRLRLFATAVFAIALAVVAATATGASQASPAKAQADGITVWLMGDAQANWPEAVAAANQAFKTQHPGVDVTVQYQSWADYKTKFEATLSAGSGPDVIEFGNTDVPKYSAAGALAPLNRSDFPNSATWLSGLTKAGSYNGKLYAVPYYAGARGVIYRTDQYKAAGIAKTPKTLAEFNTAMAKLMKQFGGSKNPNYSAVYFPGRYWYAAMTVVYDYGGQIVKTKNGKLVGAPHEPKVGNPGLTGKIGAYPMPSHTPGKYMPTFLGGSNLAVPVTSKQKALAADWIAAFTNTANMSRMATAGGVIPNTTSLARINAGKPTLAPFAEAAKYSWFVPSTPNWANVESANVLQSMLSGILRNPSKT